MIYCFWNSNIDYIAIFKTISLYNLFQAKQALINGVILQDHKAVLKGINQLLPASLENKYESYYRYLVY
jgi:hypothetical protein